MPRLLVSGWGLEQEGALAEAAAIYTEVYSAARDDDIVLASHCCLEMAVVCLLEHIPGEVAEWLARAGEPKVGDVLAQRLRNSIATVLAVQHSDRQTADWFTRQYVLQWRNALRCTLLQRLLVRGDLDAEMEAVWARFTAAAH
jgi:ubiquinone biosynthesis protein UbiJ